MIPQGTPRQSYLMIVAGTDPQNAWDGYDETAARDAWKRAAAFRQARLRG